MQMHQQLTKTLARPLLVIGLTWTGIGETLAEADSARTITTARCGSVIDGISDQILGSQTLGIQSGRIVSITETPPEMAIDLDLSDYTCLPGLVNTHVHLDANPEDAADYGVYARRTQADNLELILKNASTTVRTGFTTVRHAGAWFPDTLAMAKAKIDGGHAIGPRIQSAGPYLTIPGGGGYLTFPEIPTNKIPTESQQGIASTPEEFAERAKKAIDNGADFLKVIASGAVFSTGTEPRAPEMHQDDIEAVVAVAKKRGVKVTAHVHSDQSGQDAILAGVNSLEHASLLSDETIALAVENDVALSMDVYFAGVVNYVISTPPVSEGEPVAMISKVAERQQQVASLPIRFCSYRRNSNIN
ncbi:MAG TPA: hypothetical protein DEX20_03385 [Halieaceae bacterium]|nr:hypothetical protein [Halieaceae bacterium]